MTYTAFYNQVLAEILSGAFHDGIALLVGMLDTVSQDPKALSVARAQLGQHELFKLLKEDPLSLCLSQPQMAGHYIADLMCDHNLPDHTTSTGRRLFEATSATCFARAVRARRADTAERLIRAWRSGQRIAVLGHGQLRALERLIGQDLSNVTLFAKTPTDSTELSERFGSSISIQLCEDVNFQIGEQANLSCFDLICATDVLDDLDSVGAAMLMVAAQRALSDTGKLIFASFARGHLGSAWRSICLGWQLECYDEAELEAKAMSTGLSVETFRDATDSVVWGEFSKTSQTLSWGAKSNGY
jgi:hypothetical protein